MKIRKFNENNDENFLTVADIYENCFLDMSESEECDPPRIEETDFVNISDYLDELYKSKPEQKTESILLSCYISYYFITDNHNQIDVDTFNKFISGSYYKIIDMTDYLKSKGYSLTFSFEFEKGSIYFLIEKI